MPLKTISFVDNDDNPTWSYEFDLGAGKTAIVVTFVAGQPSKAAAAAKAAEIVMLPSNATQCMSAADLSQVVNFCALHATTGGDQAIAALGTTAGLGGNDPVRHGAFAQPAFFKVHGGLVGESLFWVTRKRTGPLIVAILRQR